ncbi:unnamed protein product [Cylicostephanus goldi]|uniref:Uncharacterized protein n=1 Tax=Cylicostephanus goldi TaxID=71465 RepID=A0A3P7NR33_CYLGO|nr:unnamed protein product [Cylicostephanus goldi]
MFVRVSYRSSQPLWNAIASSFKSVCIQILMVLLVV